MHLSMNNKIKSLINNLPETMVHFIFLLKTSHLKEYHKIGFTIFGSQKQEIWFLQKAKNQDFEIKKRRERGDTDSGPHLSGPSSSRPRRLSPAISPRRRGLRPNQRAPTWSPNPSDSIDPLFPTAEPPEGAHRRRWRLGGGARRYAGALRPVERNLRPSTAPADYDEAS